MASILIVDDDSSVRTSLRQQLEEMGHGVEDTSSGRKALLMVDRKEPDMALVDIIMPEMDGLEIIKELRRQHYRFPIIAMPAHGTAKSDWYGNIARMFGADDVLEKPFTPKEVKAVVGRLIAQRN